MAGGPFLFLGERTAGESPIVWVRARPWEDMEIVLCVGAEGVMAWGVHCGWVRGGWEVGDFGCLWAQYASHRVWQKGRVVIVNSWSAEVRQCWGMEHERDM